MKAIGKFIILEKVIEEQTTSSGIFIADNNETQTYRVVASNNVDIPVGSIVLIDNNKVDVTVKTKDYTIIHEEGIIALL